MVPELSAKVSFINAIVIALTVFFYAFLLESTTFCIHVEGNFSWLTLCLRGGGASYNFTDPPPVLQGNRSKEDCSF